MKILTFGEIMLRLKAPGHERFFQSPMLEATFGGGEANVAVSLANYGMDAEFLTVLPKNDIAECCIRELRYFGVDTKKIVRGEGRMGIYYLEGGANQLPSKVVYDRAYSSIAMAKPGNIDWDKAFEGVALSLIHIWLMMGKHGALRFFWMNANSFLIQMRCKRRTIKSTSFKIGRAHV